MSDRIAVFDARPDRAGRGAGARSTSGRRSAFVAGFVGTSNLLDGAAALAVLGRDGTWSGAPGEDPGDDPARRRPRRRRARRRGHRARGRLRRRRSPASSSTSTPAASWSPCSRTSTTSVDGRRCTAATHGSGSRGAGSTSTALTEVPWAARRSRRPRRRRGPACECLGRVMTAVAAIGAAALALAGCAAARVAVRARGGSALEPPAPARRRAAPAGLSVPTSPRRRPLATGEGALNIIVWAGLRRGRHRRQERRLGPPVRGQDRLQGQRQGRQHLRRDGQPDEDRPVRRGVRLRRRHAAAHLRRQRRAGQHRPRARTTPRSPTSSRTRPWNSVNGKMYGIPHGWGANVLMWNPKIVTTGPHVLGRRSSTRTARTRARSPPTTRRSTSLTPRCT